MSFHVELELPLLDVVRRKFLMFRRPESLVELLPPPEDEEWPNSVHALGSRVISGKIQGNVKLLNAYVIKIWIILKKM